MGRQARRRRTDKYAVQAVMRELIATYRTASNLIGITDVPDGPGVTLNA